MHSVAVAVAEQAPISKNGHGLAPLVPLPPKPHHESCPQLAYLGRAALLFQWNRQRFHDWDYSDRLFWKTFGERSVPTCTCAHRVIPSNGHVVDLPLNATQPFVLHFQHDITAPIVGSLRHRIALALVTLTNDFTFHYQDLGDPITHEPGIEHALGKSAHDVLRKLRQFEEHDAEKNLRHRRHSSSSLQGSSRRKSSSSS
jgi:hypothetical protein